MLETKAEFARRMGWNRSTATRYAATGKIVVTKEGLVDVEASQQRLAEIADPYKEGVRQRHARERQAKRGGAAAAADPAPAPASTRLDANDTTYQLLQKHRAEREAVLAELARLELAEKEGRLVAAETVRTWVLNQARAARDAILSLRYRIDRLLAGEADEAKRAEIWDRELRLICEELARGTATAIEAPHGGG